MNAADVQAMIFVGADGVAKLFPLAAPFVAAAELLVKELEAAGVISLPVPPAQVEQMRQLAAGFAAAEAQAVTSALARTKLRAICAPCAHAFAGLLAEHDAAHGHPPATPDTPG